MVRVEKLTDGDMFIPAHYAPKDPSQYTEPEKEKVFLDSSLQLILIMYNNIVNCDTVKQIWEKIEILCEGTEEVRSNQRRILISQYEGFMAKPKESITDVFERFNKLINDLQLHDKYYEAEEWSVAQNRSFSVRSMPTIEEDGAIIRVKPHQDVEKITVDAANFQDQGFSGFGLVARNHDGHLVLSKVGTLQGTVNPTLTEAMGVKEALSWAMERR
ncbi:hypothetical protein AgCh_016318 [Apium graveolens]